MPGRKGGSGPRQGNKIVGPISEDGSYRIKGGKTYDPEQKRFRPTRKPRKPDPYYDPTPPYSL